jgi:hypothetical protein
VFFLEIDLA